MESRSALWAYTRICRLEYLRGEAPAVLIPALITTSSLSALLSPTVLEGVAVFAVLYLSGFIVNALADRELDVKYDSFKREIGEATARMGVKRVRALLVAHIVVALAIAAHLTFVLGAPELFLLAAAGTFLAMAYSLPPFHLKVRGVAAHAVALSLSAFAIPFLFLYRVAAGSVDFYGWWFGAAFTLTHYGLTYTNQAYDFDLDLKEGVKTPPVRIGLRRSLRASALMVAVGLPALMAGAALLALSRPTIAAAWGTTGAVAIAAGTPALLWLGYRVPVSGLRRMLAAIKDAPSEAEAVPKMREAVHYANFHAAGVGALAVFGILLFASTVQAGVILDHQALESLAFEGTPTVSQDSGGTVFTAYIRNGGAHPLPPGTVHLWISWFNASMNPNGFSIARPFHLPWERPILPGEAAGIVIVAADERGPGSAVFNLLVDADLDGRELRVVDNATVSLP